MGRFGLVVGSVLIALMLLSGGSRWYSALMFNYYMNKGREHLSYFDTPIHKRKGGDHEGFRNAQLAVENFVVAKEYGVPGNELEDAIIKVASYTAADMR